MEFSIKPIGSIEVGEEGMFVKVEQCYKEALKGLEEFSHVSIFWWFDGCDNEKSRGLRVIDTPYGCCDEKKGIFATRSPERPNPIALTVAQVIHIDHDKASIQISFIDANNNSPVIDLKPYTPSLDRVESPSVPSWCRHWPRSLEESAEFDWEEEMKD